MAERDEFKTLVDELEDIEQRRSGSGGFSGTDDAARRQHLERRLIQLVATELPEDERRQHVRLPCTLPVRVRIAAEQGDGIVTDVGTGGAFVETSAKARGGEPVELEVERRAGEHGFRVRGKAAWAVPAGKGRKAGFGIAFDVGVEAGERHVRRFVIELLRKRLSV